MRDGTLWLQRTYPGVGRIMKRSGTHNKTIRNRFHATLDALYERGRLDILERIRDNQLTMKEVHDKFTTGKLDAVSVSDLGTLKTVANGVIQSPMLVWVKKVDLSENTRIDYQKRFNVFLKTVGATFEMSHLPRLLGQFKDKYQSKKRSFNAVRTAVMA